MSNSGPDTSTYIEPLEREQSIHSVLTIGLADHARTELTNALSSQGDEVAVEDEETASGALDRLAVDDETIDCVVIGDGASSGDGLSVFQTIRDEREQVPVIVCTSEGSGRSAIDAVNAGVDGYFETDTTDFDVDRLAERIETVAAEYRSQARLQETTRLLSKLTEYTTDSLWMFTSDWAEAAVVNSAYEDVWERPLEDLVADPGDFLEGVLPADREIVTDGMETLSSGQPAEIEYRIDTDGPDERWVSVHAEPVYDGAGTIEYVAGFTRDITELKNREEGIRSLNETTTELLHARTAEEVGWTVVDIVETVLGRTRTTVRSVHTDEAGLVPVAASENSLEAANADDIADLTTARPGSDLYDVFEREETVKFEESDIDGVLPQETELGSLLAVPLEGHGLLLVGTDTNDSFEGFERSLLEILGRTATAALDSVERNAELEAHREDLERSNENLQQFAYTASHDLQEPLRMVASYVDLLESEYGDQLDDEAAEYMEFAVDGAHRMQDMIDALLQYARVQTRAQDFEPVDLDEVVDETLTALQLRIEETETTVTVDSLPPVEGDSNQLGQVFQNLLKNAITYAEESGVDPQIEISGQREDGEVTVAVSDNGPGIEADQREAVFEIFKQGGVHDADGTGIGLAVCQRIIRRHGGEIWIEPTEADGATFMLTLQTTETEVSSDD